MKNETESDLIVIHGNLYSYTGWDEHLKMHKVEVLGRTSQNAQS